MRPAGRAGIGRITVVVSIIVILVIASVGAYFLLFLSKPSVQAPSQLNIGCVGPLTGPNAEGGQDSVIGIDFWVKHVNQAGGVYMSAYGKKIPLNLIVADDGSDATKDPALMQQMVTSSNVVAFIGCGTILEALTETPVAERLGVPLVEDLSFSNSTWNFYSSVDPHPTYAYWVWPNFANFAVIFFQWWDAQPASARPMTIAALSPNIPAFTLIAQQFLDAAKAHGMTVVMPLQVYDIAATDLSPLILKLKAANPDMVFSMSLLGDGVLFFKQAVQLRYQAKMFVFPPVVEFNTLPASLGSNVNGLVTTTMWNWASTVNASQALGAYYKNQTGNQVTPITGTGTAEAQVLVAGLHLAGSANRTLIAQVLANVNVDTVQGRVQFDSSHNSYTLYPIIVQWQAGIQKIVWPPSQASSTMIYPMPPWSG